MIHSNPRVPEPDPEIAQLMKSISNPSMMDRTNSTLVALQPHSWLQYIPCSHESSQTLLFNVNARMQSAEMIAEAGIPSSSRRSWVAWPTSRWMWKNQNSAESSDHFSGMDADILIPGQSPGTRRTGRTPSGVSRHACP